MTIMQALSQALQTQPPTCRVSLIPFLPPFPPAADGYYC